MLIILQRESIAVVTGISHCVLMTQQYDLI